MIRNELIRCGFHKSRRFGTTESARYKGEVLSNTGSLFHTGCGTIQCSALAAPFGITYVPPKGTKVVLLEEEDTVLCTGAISESINLSEGELMLRSSGGAYIYLKNNGDIVINGRSISSAINLRRDFHRQFDTKRGYVCHFSQRQAGVIAASLDTADSASRGISLLRNAGQQIVPNCCKRFQM